MNNGTKSGRFVKGLVVGAFVGTAVGLLVAPQTGRQTRGLVRRKHKTAIIVGCGATPATYDGGEQHAGG